MSNFKNTIHKYGIFSQLLHWSMASIIFINFYLVYYRDYIPEADPWNLIYIRLHKALGVTVLLIAILFFIKRFIDLRPAYPLQVTSVEKRIAKVTHYLLFTLIFGICISGIIMSIFNGKPTYVFNLFTIPALQVPNLFWAGVFHAIHEYMAYMIMGVISLHVLAALYHHFIMRDNVLRRMLPGKLK